MGFKTQSIYNNTGLSTTAVSIAVPAKEADIGGNGGTIRKARVARVKNASSVNIVYVRRNAVATSTAYDLAVNPGLEDDMEIGHDDTYISVIASASGTPMNVMFGGFTL